MNGKGGQKCTMAGRSFGGEDGSLGRSNGAEVRTQDCARGLDIMSVHRDLALVREGQVKAAEPGVRSGRTAKP
jgi:hypothetical protein